MMGKRRRPEKLILSGESVDDMWNPLQEEAEGLFCYNGRGMYTYVPEATTP
jgi:hypothetical protein